MPGCPEFVLCAMHCVASQCFDLDVATHVMISALSCCSACLEIADPPVPCPLDYHSRHRLCPLHACRNVRRLRLPLVLCRLRLCRMMRRFGAGTTQASGSSCKMRNGHPTSSTKSCWRRLPSLTNCMAEHSTSRSGAILKEITYQDLWRRSEIILASPLGSPSDGCLQSMRLHLRSRLLLPILVRRRAFWALGRRPLPQRHQPTMDSQGVFAASNLHKGRPGNVRFTRMLFSRLLSGSHAPRQSDAYTCPAHWTLQVVLPCSPATTHHWLRPCFEVPVGACHGAAWIPQAVCQRVQFVTLAS